MKQVLLSSHWYDQELHKGVAEYSANAGWHLVTDLQGFSPDNWTGDGLIARANSLSPRTLKSLEEAGVSLVDVQSRPQHLTHPLVATYLEETVRLAFDYFRQQKGFQSFGFFGSDQSLRGRKFRAVVESEGFDCSTCNVWYKDFASEQDKARTWVLSLDKPAAVYCDNDSSASALTSILLDLEVDIPDQVAVLGTDNNELVCNSSCIPISSIDTNLFEVGYKAAEILDAMMQGYVIHPQRHLVSPKRIIERASTDTLAVKSPTVRHAIDIMRRDYPHQLTINDLVADMHISQATIERAFKKEFGITPANCLRNIRMKEAARLLRSTNHKIDVISHKVGMGNSKHFSTVFKRSWGVSPRQYRRENIQET